MALISLFYLFQIYTCVFLKVAFNSIKEINRLRKELNRLLSKGMIYFEYVTFFQ